MYFKFFLASSTKNNGIKITRPIEWAHIPINDVINALHFLLGKKIDC